MEDSWGHRRVYRWGWELRADPRRMYPYSCGVLSLAGLPASPRYAVHPHLLLRRVYPSLVVQDYRPLLHNQQRNPHKRLHKKRRKGLPDNFSSLLRKLLHHWRFAWRDPCLWLFKIKNDIEMSVVSLVTQRRCDIDHPHPQQESSHDPG